MVKRVKKSSRHGIKRVDYIRRVITPLQGKTLHNLFFLINHTQQRNAHFFIIFKILVQVEAQAYQQVASAVHAVMKILTACS